MVLEKDRGYIFLVTDRKLSGFREGLLAALAEGIDFIQIREKDLSPRELYDFSKTIMTLAGKKAGVIINGRADVALALDACGVHLGAASPPLSEIRKIIKDGMLLGYSAHSLPEAAEAATNGADYIFAGPVFEKKEAPEGSPVLGPAFFNGIKDIVNVPVIAVGGITEITLPRLLNGQAGGIAAIRSLISAPAAIVSAYRNIQKA